MMSESNNFSEKRKFFHALVFPLFFLLLVWVTFIVFTTLNAEMALLGIYPQTFKGLIGIVGSPFAHGSWGHLAGNSVSFLALSVGLFYFYRLIAYKVFFINWLISGILLWIGGRDSYHIGLSGIVYGLAFFVFFSGVMRRSKQLSALSLVVVFLYGSMVWGMVPQGGNISWEGHLYGAMAGISLAWYYRKNPIDFIPAPDNSSVSITWGQHFEVDYEYISDTPERDDEDTARENR